MLSCRHCKLYRNECCILSLSPRFITLFVLYGFHISVHRKIHLCTVSFESKKFTNQISFSILAYSCLRCLYGLYEPPKWTTLGLQWGFNQTVNRTRWNRWQAENRADIVSFSEIFFFNMFIPAVTQTVVIAESTLLIYSLKNRRKFRFTATLTEANVEELGVTSTAKTRNSYSKLTRSGICKNLTTLTCYFLWCICFLLL